MNCQVDECSNDAKWFMETTVDQDIKERQLKKMYSYKIPLCDLHKVIDEGPTVSSFSYYLKQ